MSVVRPPAGRGLSPATGVEAVLFRSGLRQVAGVDEVGRGAWAGPVTVGVAVLGPEGVARFPAGVRDSKALDEPARERLALLLAGVLDNYATGHASPAECDALGMTRALGLAAVRAVRALGRRLPPVVLLDGRDDYLSPVLRPGLGRGGAGAGRGRPPEVRTVVGGDATVALVAAASILAKSARDALMREEAEHYPWYGFDRNKGYPAPAHRMALMAWGTATVHRRSWSYVAQLPWR